MARRDEISAGLLAFRQQNGLQFLLAHPGGPFWARKDNGAWTIPKGLVRPDDLLAGALREFNDVVRTAILRHDPSLRATLEKVNR